MAKRAEKLKSDLSISAFFPCFNDAGTIASIVTLAQVTLKKLTREFEIIVVDDGSTDGSKELLKELASNNPNLKVIFHRKNEGYGGALISGFRNSIKELVFYTDGDFQYDVRELENLAEKLSDKVDIVQGYKIERRDPWYRILIGDIYNYAVKFAFNIKVRDVDCDFRLIRRRVFDNIKLTHKSGVITVEMVKKIQDEGFKFAEVPVSHFFRSYGGSQFFNFRRIARVGIELLELWKELVFDRWLGKISSKTKAF